jgi:hypothetical protein
LIKKPDLWMMHPATTQVAKGLKTELLLQSPVTEMRSRHAEAEAPKLPLV